MTRTLSRTHAPPARVRSFALALAFVSVPPAVGSPQGAGRPLAIEDYYRMKNVGAPNMSRDGRWVAFDVTTRVEATNGTDSEVWLVPADASTPARRVSPAAVNATAPSWMDDGRLRFSASGHVMILDPAAPDRIDSSTVDTSGRGGRGGAAGGVGRGGGRGGRGGAELPQTSADGKWVASVKAVPFQKRAVPALTDFEKRHEDHFKGAEFDWLPFHQDGGQFPVPNRNDPEVNPPQEVFLAAAGGGAEKLPGAD